MSNPKPSLKQYLEMYKWMARSRALQEGLILNRKKIDGPLLVGLGSEAIMAGMLGEFKNAGMLKNSVINTEHRLVYTAAAILDEFVDVDDDTMVLDLIRNYFSRSTGGTCGLDGNVHMAWPKYNLYSMLWSHLGQTPVIMNGVAETFIWDPEWQSLPQEKRPVVVTCYGDGAESQGSVHSAMKYASVRKLPIIFVINNNQIALFTTPKEQHGGAELYKRALGYANMEGVQVDGTNVLEVYRACRWARVRAQKGQPSLIECVTHRLCGHNSDQIKYGKGAFERRAFFDIESVTGLSEMQVDELREAAKSEPLRRLQEFLHPLGVFDGEVCPDPLNDSVIAEARTTVDAEIAEILHEPKVRVLDYTKRKPSVMPAFPKVANSDWPVEPDPDKTDTEKKWYNESFTSALKNLMKHSPHITYGGEDVADDSGGVLAITRELYTDFPGRVINTPLSEDAICGAALGIGLSGYYGISVGGHKYYAFREMQFAPFGADALQKLLLISLQHYQRDLHFPASLIYPCGIVHGGGSGHNHESWPERHLVPLKGVVVVAPSNAYQAAGFVYTASLYPGPVVILMQISAGSMDEFKVEVPTEPFLIPFGKTEIARVGTDVTVVTYGAACVSAAKNEARFIKRETGVSVEVLDLRTVYPWDRDAILQSVEKTHRLVIMHEDSTEHGVGDMIIADLVRNSVLGELVHEKIDVLGASHPFVPTAAPLVWDSLPYERYTEKIKGGRSITRHRSKKLACLISDLMKYK